jgi:hypothetical protein
MREELRETLSYFSILHGVSSGQTRPNGIAQAAGRPLQSLAKYRWLGWEPARIGQYWDSKTELDVVAEDLAGERVAFLECKWSTSVEVEKEIRILQAKTRALPQFAKHQQEYFVVSRTESKHPKHIRLAF